MMMNQDNRYIEDLENALREEKNRTSQLGRATTMFSNENNDNLIKWQLDIKEELERIEHLLRKHIMKVDKDGNEYWENPQEGHELFNERGIQEILNIIAWYLNKNIILSNYTEEEVQIRILQFGIELTDFIFINYESFGLTNEDKIKHFPMVVMNIVNSVEAAYHRAIRGGERDSLRTGRTVTQTEPLVASPYGRQSNSGFSIFNPRTWRSM